MSRVLTSRRAIFGASPAKDPFAGMTHLTNRLLVPNSYGSAANVQLMSQSAHRVFSASSNQYTVFRFANWRVIGNTGEVANGAPATGRASLLYWSASQQTYVMTRLLALADRSDTAAAADGDFLNFFCQADPLPGTAAYVRFFGNFPNGISIGQYQADYAGGDILRYGAAGSVTDLTGTTTAFSDTYQGNRDRYGPTEILGFSAYDSMIDWCDSIGVGLGAAPDDLYGNNGTGQKYFGRLRPGVMVAAPGETIAVLSDPTKTVRRRQIASRGRYQLIEAGSNDIEAMGVANATVMAQCQALVGQLNKPAIIATLPPWTTGSNTAPNANDAKAVAFNVEARAVPSGFVACFDRAAPLETAGRLWASAGYMVDNVHPSTAGDNRVRDNAVFDLATIGNPSALDVGTQLSAPGFYQSIGMSDWTAQNGVWTPRTVLGADGRASAGILKEDGSASDHNIFKQLSGTLTTGAKTLTIYGRRGAGARNIRGMIQNSDGFESTAGTSFNLAGAGSVFFNLGSGSKFTAGAATITVDKFGFFKLTMPITVNTATSAPYLFVQMGDASGVNGYAGDNTSSVVIFAVDLR